MCVWKPSKNTLHCMDIGITVIKKFYVYFSIERFDTYKDIIVIIIILIYFLACDNWFNLPLWWLLPSPFVCILQSLSFLIWENGKLVCSASNSLIFIKYTYNTHHPTNSLSYEYLYVAVCWNARINLKKKTQEVYKLE